MRDAAEMRLLAAYINSFLLARSMNRVRHRGHDAFCAGGADQQGFDVHRQAGKALTPSRIHDRRLVPRAEGCVQ
jgi:hypothetical protein